ncbi:ABC transporter ATP-binding protein [Rubeoparvulum massiliense]|uniref:ABC transporter ATP-binding protein n=1 Tax=Rubeoparvulum massiliense TaxID=1631346 RepID=UPI00065E290A|nr:ABC transporter ATP-binding protein [Rubeoparvulum massiliense]
MTLQLEHVRKEFGKFVAVKDFNLSIAQGEMFGLLGANGAGKTTTIRMILGLLAPTSGKILWKGKKINYSITDQIGYLPEERGLYPKLNVVEQLAYLGELKGMKRSEAKDEANRWLERLQVPEFAKKKVEELSKGNQQKIQFISSILHRPSLLFLDEPFSGLDPVNVELLKESLVHLHQNGTTIIFSSHRMEHVEELCKELCILHHGEMVLHGNLKEIKRSFGKRSIVLHTTASDLELESIAGVSKVKTTAEGYEIQIVNEEVSQEILAHVSGKGFITKFALEEPSLNEIFIEKVGGHGE